MKICKGCNKELPNSDFCIQRNKSGIIKKTGNYCCECYRKRDNELRKLRKKRENNINNTVETIPFILDASKKPSNSNIIRVDVKDVQSTFVIENIIQDIKTFRENLEENISYISMHDVFSKYNILYKDLLITQINSTYDIISKLTQYVYMIDNGCLAKLKQTYCDNKYCTFNFNMDYCPDGWFSILNNSCQDLIRIAQSNNCQGVIINFMIHKGIGDFGIKLEVVAQCADNDIINRIKYTINNTMFTCAYCGTELHDAMCMCDECKKIVNMFELFYKLKPQLNI